MKVLSIAPRRERNGVSHYAGALEAELERLGCEVVAESFGSSRSHARRRTAFDLLIVHHELISGMRRADVLTLPRLVASLNCAAKLVIAHSVMRTRDGAGGMRLASAAVVAYQRALFARVGSVARIAALRPEGAAAIATLTHADVASFHMGYFAHPGAVPRRPDGRPLTIGVVGHAFGFKHFERAAAAYAGMRERAKAGTQFHVVGGGGYASGGRTWASALRCLRAQLGERLIVTGPLEHHRFVAALAALDVVLMPYDERLHASAVLAHVVPAGCVAIVSNASVFDELVTRGAALRAGEWPASATALLERIAADPGSVTAVSERALRLAQTFTLAATARSILASVAR